jgi:hypothetical protein
MGKSIRGALLLVGMLGVCVGCSNGTAKGDPPATQDAGRDADPAARETGGSDAPDGTTFSDLYGDLFSRAGAAKCQSPTCHGSNPPAGGPYMGTDRSGVYQAFTTYQYLGKAVVAPGSNALTQSALLDIVDPDTGFMPRIDPTIGNRKLTQEELQRIGTWLSRGAPFD